MGRRSQAMQMSGGNDDGGCVDVAITSLFAEPWPYGLPASEGEAAGLQSGRKVGPGKQRGAYHPNAGARIDFREVSRRVLGLPL